MKEQRIKLGLLYEALKYMVIGFSLLLVALFLYGTLLEGIAERQVNKSMDAIPNYNYIPDIKALKEQGMYREALDMARFVISHPDMPGQNEAKDLERELERELTSIWGRSKRATKGFVTGSGDSVEELGGSIASDMFFWGDLRDLGKQAYCKARGKETDPFIVALASLGLLTEFVDAVDWAPAVLKAFRKVGALSQKFADFVMVAAKRSVKGRKLDGSLKVALDNLKKTTESLGISRTAGVMKHVDNPAELASITAVAQKNADAVYFTAYHGGSEGVKVVKSLGDSNVSVHSMALAAKKGPEGLKCLRKGGSCRNHILRSRYFARVAKNLRLGRPYRVLVEMAKRIPVVRKTLGVCVGLFLAFSTCLFIKSFRRFSYLSVGLSLSVKKEAMAQ